MLCVCVCLYLCLGRCTGINIINRCLECARELFLKVPSLHPVVPICFALPCCTQRKMRHDYPVPTDCHRHKSYEGLYETCCATNVKQKRLQKIRFRCSSYCSFHFFFMWQTNSVCDILLTAARNQIIKKKLQENGKISCAVKTHQISIELYRRSIFVLCSNNILDSRILCSLLFLSKTMYVVGA